MKNKYSCIAILEGEPLNRLKELQREIYKLTGSEEYRKKWPLHTTVGVGNEMTEEEFNEASEKLKKISEETKTFSINLNGITFEKNPKIKNLNPIYEPYVIHVTVMINKDLKDLVKKIDPILREYGVFSDIFPYHPHITLAGRDLTKEGIEKLKKEMKDIEFKGRLKVKGFSMVLAPLKENGLKAIKEVERFYFSED